MQVKRYFYLLVYGVANVAAFAFSPDGLPHRDLAEVSCYVRNIADDGGIVYDFSQGEIIDGNVKWIYNASDSAANITFLQTRYNLKGNHGNAFFLVSEESRLKSIHYDNPLLFNATDTTVAFGASGYYCKTAPINISGAYSFTAARCNVIVAPGDTLSNITKSTLTVRYKGNVGIEGDDMVDADSLPTFLVSKSVFIADGNLMPCAVVIDERIYDNAGAEIGKAVRYFTDVMMVGRKERNETAPEDKDDSDITLSIRYSSGAIYVSAQGIPADGIVAVMDNAGNIYRSSTITGNCEAVIDVSGLPFGRYIVSVSSESQAISIKELVYIR